MNQTAPIPDIADAAPDPVDPRVAEILASIRRAFAEKGFDGASMQDLARAAGMSVGNFYRYFASKAAIVTAIIEADLHGIESDFAEMLAAPEPFALLKQAIRQRLPHHQASKDGELWAEITAVAQRNSDIGTAACRMEGRIRTALLAVIARQTGLSLDAATERFAAEADFLLLQFRAATSIGDDDSAHRDRLNALIIASIDQTLDSITRTARTF